MNESEGLHPPDWDRYAVTRDGAAAPVGNPTLWGNQVFVPMPAAALFTTLQTPQFIQLATSDAYARSWSVLGTLTLPIATWQYTELTPFGGLQVELLITMGVGLARITHSIMLLFPGHFGPSAGPVSPAGGLCLSQNWFYGGPYNPISEALGEDTRPFAIVGGLVGQSIAIRANYLNYGAATPGLPATSRLNVIITPYAAGQGL